MVVSQFGPAEASLEQEGNCAYHSAVPRSTVTFDLRELDGRLLFVDPRTEVTGDPPTTYLMSADILGESYDSVVIRCQDDGAAQAVRADRRLRSFLAGIDAATLVGSRSLRQRKPKLVPFRGSRAVKQEIAREAEVRGIILSRGAVLGGPGAHFHLASGYHQTSYVRIGDALREIRDLDRLADWILPFIDRDVGLLGDRPTLAPLLLAVQLAALDRFGWRLPAATLEPYPRESRTAARTVSDLAEQAKRGLVVIVGVGRNKHQERELMRLAPPRSRAITLVDLSTEEIAGAAPLARVPIPQWKVDAASGTCGDECDPARIVGIDPESEERIVQPHRTPFAVAPRLFEKNQDFWEAVSATEALRLHHDVAYPEGTGESGTRHRPIDIDLARLLLDEDVWATCVSRLAAFETPDITLIPQHETTEALEQLVASTHPESIPVPVPGGPFEDYLVTTMHDASKILILDDAIVTGKTLRRLLDRIRFALGDEHFAEKDVRVFTPLLCAANQDAARRVRNRVTPGAKNLDRIGSGAGFVFAYEVPLPDDSSCPWCEEWLFLNQLQPKMPRHDELIRSRLESLSARRSDADLLLTYPGLPQHERDAFISDSVVGEDVHVSVVFAAFASAVQSYRYTTSANGEAEHYIDLAHLVTNWWGVGMFAGVLRTITQAEGKYAAQARPLAEAWRERETWRQAELVEFTWAALLDRVPAEVKSLVRATVKAHPGQSAAMRFARDLLDA